ncbi:putative hormone-sensitive lipase [Rosellinia necatrix]|uniref:Putative hormone-sensitive lipase n=1 Tax=Rosellinia necatrix TaxID=77044 RepID=A0A1S7UKQ1_ROSNE|nr:putative hormone-sensitive lipase [Rosellinia necatrix]
MIDHVLGRPSAKSRRLQVLGVLTFWSVYLYRGNRHGPPFVRLLSKLSSKRLTGWQIVIFSMMYLYATRNFSTLVGLASPEPMANLYDAAFFRATWVLTALDAGFWTAMKIRKKWLRDIASMAFSLFYLVAAERADEKVRKVRGALTVDHLRVSWNKGTSPYLSALTNIMRPRFTRWPPRAIRIPRPNTSDYKEPVSGWLYYDGPISDLEHINKVILDIPGGGFVAMDPRCHDDKLLAWAGKTGLPVLSLDYQKAPEYPYPYALNECFDVYATIIKSKGRCIGMSGRETPKIVVTGDSAGGNLATAMTLMIIETATNKRRSGLAQEELPIPSGLVLLYPALDMNIGNWMSDEQMSLIKDRRTRATNKNYLKRKNMQYNDLVGTPHQSDDEDEYPFSHTPAITAPDKVLNSQVLQSPHPEYSHASPQTWPKSQSPASVAPRESQSLSHHPEPMRTRLAMASMISYFNDRIITPEMMRAMIILYIGPHNRPDFSQDYLLAPILAPDALLERFPKTYLLTGERDPLVDDTVIFAGRLRRVKHACHARREAQGVEGPEDVIDFDDKDVTEVVLIPGISHGFMQFPSLYPPAWKLIDRCAQWAEDLLNTAESRERREQRRSRFRYPIHTESSGDEDRPLEINMTRLRGRAGSGIGRPKTEDFADKSGDEHDGAETNGIPGRKKRVNGRGRGGRGSRSIVKLDSSDDLLSRRMQGLAGPLTGLPNED